MSKLWGTEYRSGLHKIFCRQNLEINGAAGYDQVFQASRNSDLEALYELLGQQGQRSSRAPVENKVKILLFNHSISPTPLSFDGPR